MSFGFSSSANATGGASGTSGPDLPTIQTEGLGFQTIAGDAKVRLTSSWDPLPAPTSTLLSTAPRKGLVAAAGPDQITIATTESVRKAFEGPKDGDSDARSFEPQLKLPMPMRVSQLTFTADENYLILSAESGGGLAVYEVQSLLSGSTSSSFGLPTNGESLRSLAPNPTPDKAELCAIVTNNGNLHMANLKERRISDSLRNQVSCVSWSSKGKQLCAGTANGTIHQLTPEGEAKAEIPKPPGLGNYHVSSLAWLENNVWLAIYTSADTQPFSVYNIITRQPPSSFTFQKIGDPIEPFTAEKPPQHSVLRLRDYGPNLQDLLLVSSTASTDIGLLTRSKKALDQNKPAESITGIFTTTELLDDTRRPTLPMTESMDDSVPIGFALDLSSKEKVYKPIPADDELEESPHPLPGVWVLTQEGLLCSWWLVYNDSINEKIAYPGLAIVEATNPTTAPSAPTAARPAAAASPFSNPGVSAFGSSNTPAFGTASQLGSKPSPWGSATTTTNPSPQTGGAVFGSSSFGNAPSTPSAPAFGKPAFGQTQQLGMRTSPWQSSGASGPTFGQTGFASFSNNNTNSSPFGSASQSTTPAAAAPGAAAPSGGGFAGFASNKGFAGLAAPNSGQSVFGSGNKPSASPFSGSNDAATNQSVFGSGNKPSASPFSSSNVAATSQSVFGSGNPSSASPFSGSKDAATSTAFPPKDHKPTASPFGSAGFKLESSFKPDPSSKDDNETPSKPSNPFFGSAFGSTLDATKNQQAPKDEDMDATEATQKAEQPKPVSIFASQQSTESTTPTSTPAPSKFMTSQSPFTGSSIFKSQPSKSLFGSTDETPKPSPFSGFFGSKREEQTSSASKDQDAPLPPDATSKLAYPLGDSSSSSASSNSPFSSTQVTTSTPSKPVSSPFTATPKDEPPTAGESPESPGGTDAPLPPDFVNVPKSKVKEEPISPEAVRSKPSMPDAPLPPDFSISRPAVKPEDAPLPSFIAPKAPSKEPSSVAFPSDEDEDEDEDESEDDNEDEHEDEVEEEDEEDSEEEEGRLRDNASEGSGVDVARDLSPSTSGLTPTPGFTPQSSFGGARSTGLFGEVSRNAPLLPRPNATSPRSPSPVRNAIPNRMLRSDAPRSVSAPGMASQILGSKKSHSQLRGSILEKDRRDHLEDPFIAQQRRMKARQEAEQRQPLVDEEDDEVQKMLASEVKGTLVLDEFIAYTNTAPPAKESIPSQVEAVYRDVNSMIDTLGLNSRSLESFIKGHREAAKEGGRHKDDLDIPDDWVLCEIPTLGQVLDDELWTNLEDGRVRDVEGKLRACQELSREMHRLRVKQEDLRKTLLAKTDPDQTEAARSMPLSAEQASQQNEIRREFTNFSKLLNEAEEALTLLKTRIAAASGSSGKGKTNMPTVEAIMRTITKMTTLFEKRSGDIDVLENQMRKVRLGSTSREGSPAVTPQAKKQSVFSPESTPSRTLRHSFAASVGSMGSPARATPPRKKLSGFSKEEKGELMERRARRQAVLDKLKNSVEKKGVHVWNMEEIE